METVGKRILPILDFIRSTQLNAGLVVSSPAMEQICCPWEGWSQACSSVTTDPNHELSAEFTPQCKGASTRCCHYKRVGDAWDICPEEP
ncbi:Spermatogenesis-associated protein 16 [Cricetulus griseus]|uniref:Spermatogenesis-associated protein 16 n=1 Tax=Cricetulus griseus TaxID=10029 RepID=G3H6G9_CRIGR|nr:Spermatogenesis-associated protein 16 [Cricetulus griseus]